MCIRDRYEVYQQQIAVPVEEGIIHHRVPFGIAHPIQQQFYRIVTLSLIHILEVDGGVNLETGSRLVEAGSDVLVAGNAVFSAPDPKEAKRCIRDRVE